MCVCVSISSSEHGPVSVAIFQLLSVNFESGLLEGDAKRIDALSGPRAEFKALIQVLSTTCIIPGDSFVPYCEMQNKFQNLNQQSAGLVLETYNTVLLIAFSVRSF